MKKASYLPLVACIVFCNTAHPQPPNSTLKIVYTLAENDLVPEGIAYDARTKSFYLSSTYKQKIVRINENGQATDFIHEGEYRIQSVVGMRIDTSRGFLWAASSNVGEGMPMKNMDTAHAGITSLYKFNLATGGLVKKYTLSIPGQKHAFNDLTLDAAGKPYVTDTWGKKIYTLDAAADSLVMFLDVADKYMPNGIDITPDNKYLYVAMYADPNAVISRVDIATKKMELVDFGSTPMSGADGLYFYHNSLVAVLPNDGKDTIAQFFLNPQGNAVVKTIYNVTGSKLIIQPTTGVVVGDKLYFNGISNLHLFRQLYEKQKGIVNQQQLPAPRIGMVTLATAPIP